MAIIGEGANTNLFKTVESVAPLAEQDLSLPELADDLFRCVGSFGHVAPFSILPSLTLLVDTFSGGRPADCRLH